MQVLRSVAIAVATGLLKGTESSMTRIQDILNSFSKQMFSKQLLSANPEYRKRYMKDGAIKFAQVTASKIHRHFLISLELCAICGTKFRFAPGTGMIYAPTSPDGRQNRGKRDRTH